MLRKALIIFIICFFASGVAFAANKKTTYKRSATIKKTTPVKKDVSTKEVEWAAKVNGKLIPMKKFKMAVDYYINEASKKLNEGQELASEEVRDVSRSIVEQMIESELIAQLAKDMGIIVSETDLNKKISEMKKKFPSPSEFHKSLAARGMTVEDLKSSVEKDMLVEKIINRKLKELAVSDEDIQRFYNKNMDLYVQQAKIRLKQISVGTREVAENVLNKLKEGESFEDLVKRFSEDEETKVEGGDIGVVEKDDLDEKIAKAVFKLKPKEISDIIETEKGFYIFKVEDKFPAQESDYDDAKDNIRTFLLNEKARIVYLKQLEEQKNESTIIVNMSLKHLFKD